jgi:hypothetical protein
MGRMWLKSIRLCDLSMNKVSTLLFFRTFFFGFKWIIMSRVADVNREYKNVPTYGSGCSIFLLHIIVSKAKMRPTTRRGGGCPRQQEESL